MFSRLNLHTFQHLQYSTWQKIATALCFFSLGFATAAWAPIIAYVKKRLFLNHSDFGLLLLGAGIGSMIAMPIAGKLAHKFGCRPVLAVTLFAFMFILPTLAMSPTVWVLASALFCFGASAGALGVTVNLQASQLEKYSQKNMMPVFHGICSLGGLAGVLGITTLLSFGFTPLVSMLMVSIVLLIIECCAVPFCLKSQQEDSVISKADQSTSKSRPNLAIISIGLICFIAFLSEGAAMDWSGIYLNTRFKVDPAHSGLAYSFFAALMVAGRLSGQWIVQRLGEKNTILISAILACCGMATVVIAPVWQVVLLGYAMLGLGSANIVPLMFSFAGRQKALASHVALSYVSLFAYTGSLMGPAIVGFGGDIFGLSTVFMMVAVALSGIAFLYHMIHAHKPVYENEVEHHNQTPA